MTRFLFALLMMSFLQPAMAQRKYNAAGTGDSPTQIYMVKVQGGEFDMGSDDDAADRKPAHTVKLKDFSIGAYEVTQELWDKVMGSNPSSHQCYDCPVTDVSWNDIQKFIEKLNDQTGKHYRLPTEAEWEYAARGGSKEVLVKTRERGGIDVFLDAEPNQKVMMEKDKDGKKYSGKRLPQDVAWYDGNSKGRLHAIGRKKPNELGLYDMSGNVEEWCTDWYAVNYGSKNTVENPQGPASGNAHVVRGGSWASSKDEIVVTYRAAYLPGTRSNALGFRLAED